MTLTMVHDSVGLTGVLGSTDSTSIDTATAVFNSVGVYYPDGGGYTFVPWGRVVTLKSASTGFNQVLPS